MNHHCPSCGSPMRQRSNPHHRFFFAAIQRAFENWPEGEKFIPEDADHLRSYLLIRAGWFQKLDLRVDNPDAVSLEDQLRSIIKTVADKPPLIHTYPWGCRLFWPRSISYAAADRKEFNQVCDKVFEIISEKLGVSVNELKRESALEPA